jgi:predicted PurR-regulated permease PerM
VAVDDRGEAPPPPPPAEIWRVKPTIGSTLLVIAAIGTAIVVGDVFVAARRTLGWALATAIVACLLSAIIDLLSRWMRRGIALLLTILVVAALGVGTWLGVMTSLRSEVNHIRVSLPASASKLERRYDAAAQFRLTERVNSFVAGVDKRFSSSAAVSKAAGTAPVYFVNGVLLLFFLGYGPRFLSGALDQIADPDRRAKVAQVFSRAAIRARTYVLLTLAQVLVIVVVGTVAFSLLGLPAPFVLGLALGTMSAVPYLGCVLGILPALLLAVADGDRVDIVGVIALVVALQLVELLVIRRYVDHRTIRVGPALVLIGGIIGFELYGGGGAVYGTIALVFGLAVVDSWSAVTPAPAPAPAPEGLPTSPEAQPA